MIDLRTLKDLYKPLEINNITVFKAYFITADDLSKPEEHSALMDIVLNEKSEHSVE